MKENLRSENEEYKIIRLSSIKSKILKYSIKEYSIYFFWIQYKRVKYYWVFSVIKKILGEGGGGII